MTTNEEMPKPKQYLIMADELHMALFARLLPGLLFLQVEGMNVEKNDQHMLLVTPKPKPVENDVTSSPVDETPERT